MLRTAFGAAIARFLEDSTIVEVMLNPDGRLWIDRLSSGLADTGEMVPPSDGERIVRLVAHHVGAEVHAASPRVSAELPETGERFEGLLPPVVAAPSSPMKRLCPLPVQYRWHSRRWGQDSDFRSTLPPLPATGACS